MWRNTFLLYNLSIIFECEYGHTRCELLQKVQGKRGVFVDDIIILFIERKIIKQFVMSVVWILTNFGDNCLEIISGILTLKIPPRRVWSLMRMLEIIGGVLWGFQRKPKQSPLSEIKIIRREPYNLANNCLFSVPLAAS